MKNRMMSFLAALKNNLPVKLISLAISIVIWLLVVHYVNPDDTRRLDNIKIDINTEDSVPVGEGLVLVTDFDETVDIVYTASRDVIAMLNTDKITAYVDLSSAVRSGEYNFPVRIDTGGQNITVEGQSVTEVTLKFEKSITAQVPVTVSAKGSVPEGYIKNDPVCIPSVLNIEGPESVVNRIAAAEVTLDTAEFSETKVYTSKYEYADADGNIIADDFITADYQTVDVTITVLRTKTLPVTAAVVNSSGGYDNNFATLTLDPGSITVAGSADILETMNSYDLGTIDVAERTADFEQTYVVSLPNGVRNINEVSSVRASVKFDDVMTKKIRFTNFSVENVADGQTAVVSDASLEVTFRGISSDIAKINADNVRLVVDLQSKPQSVGANSVPVYAIIPDTYKVGVSGKYYVTVNVK